VLTSHIARISSLVHNIVFNVIVGALNTSQGQWHFAVLPTQVWLGIQRKITRSIRPCNQPRVMNSEPTDYEGGLMNFASKIMAVKYQVLGETHGLPYLATLYCAQGHWHRLCLSCCYVLRIVANNVFTFKFVITLFACRSWNSIEVSTHLRTNVPIVLCLSAVHAPLNKIRTALERITTLSCYL